MAEKTSIKVVQKLPFPAVNDSALLTNHDLSMYVNTVLFGTFADYTGCKIYVDQSDNPAASQLVMNQYHPVQVELYFTLNGGNIDDQSRKLVAFRPITDKIGNIKTKGKMNYTQQAMGYNVSVTQNKSSEITQDAIDIFSDIMWNDVGYKLSSNPTAQEFNNKGIVVEATTSNDGSPHSDQNRNQTVIYNIVNFTDINKILDMLYDDNGKSVSYQTVPIKPIIPPMNGYMIPGITDQKWLFSVNRIDKENLADVCNKIGSFNYIGGLNICTDTF